MTQVKSAQKISVELARYHGADHRSLAERRAAFAAQMRDMALSDLNQVSSRLKDLHHEFEEKDGRRWAHYDLAREMGIKPRTFQSWENGEVENRNGKGYDKMARFYSRKLNRKITRQWILFGDAPASEPADPVSEPEPREVDQLRRVVAEYGEAQTELSKELVSLRRSQEETLMRVERLEHGGEGTGT
jgi:ribosome-binding protein aMBF1 (putative translation factor)